MKTPTEEPYLPAPIESYLAPGQIDTAFLQEVPKPTIVLVQRSNGNLESYYLVDYLPQNGNLRPFIVDNQGQQSLVKTESIKLCPGMFVHTENCGLARINQIEFRGDKCLINIEFDNDRGAGTTTIAFEQLQF